MGFRWCDEYCLGVSRRDRSECVNLKSENSIKNLEGCVCCT